MLKIKRTEGIYVIYSRKIDNEFFLKLNAKFLQLNACKIV